MARTPQDPQIRITEIIDAAEDLFTIKGYHGTTISDIAKKMGVAQGMCYYYFKSKEQILLALLNRHASSFVTDIKNIVFDTISPPDKISLMFRIMLDGICYKDKTLLHIVCDEQNLYIKEQLDHQIELSLTPWGLAIIKEGCEKGYFSLSHPQISLDFMLIVLKFLIETFYKKNSEKSLDEILSMRLKMAESLIEKALGAAEGTIHIFH